MANFSDHATIYEETERIAMELTRLELREMSEKELANVLTVLVNTAYDEVVYGWRGCKYYFLDEDTKKNKLTRLIVMMQAVNKKLKNEI